MQQDVVRWAREEFSSVETGDQRRTRRLVKMAARAYQNPGGKVSEVFQLESERQGAYDLLEEGKVRVEAVGQALGRMAAERASAEAFAYVAIDGSSLRLTDERDSKGFGRIGTQEGSRGLKVMNALGLSPRGVPLGLFSQVWWARPLTPVRKGSAKERRAQKGKSKRQRGPLEKETRYWLQAIEEATDRADETGAKLWFLLDREADCQATLMKLTDSNHQFTVRGSWNRVIEGADDENQRLLQRLGQKSAQGAYEVEVPAGPKRTARRARLAVRWEKVELRMASEPHLPEQRLELTALWACEQGTHPSNEKPLEWLLLTSAELRSLQDARDVLFGYTLRWRVESFHKTWKTGACNVEDSQLRSQHAVTLWATMLAAVATRIERLKLLSRSEPEKPADVELDPYEIRALILLKRIKKKRTETIPDTMPTISDATRWLAELGGYTGRSSGGPPGAITIRRGLEYLQSAVELLRHQEAKK